MRATVEIIIRSQAGNTLSQLAPHQIDLGVQSLHDIEKAVERWKRLVLPEIEADLLNQAQSRFTQQIKKPEDITFAQKNKPSRVLNIFNW